MSKEEYCTSFIVGDGFEYDLLPHEQFCRCPKCSGFLPQDFPIGGTQFKCKKCGSVLETIPNYEGAKEDDWLEDMEEDFKDLTPEEIDEEVYENYGGKICLVPDYAVKKE